MLLGELPAYREGGRDVRADPEALSAEVAEHEVAVLERFVVDVVVEDGAVAARAADRPVGELAGVLRDPVLLLSGR